MMHRSILLALALATPGTALAQSLDAHGFHLGTFSDDPTSALQLVTPGAAEKNAWYLTGVAEWADKPLVAVALDGTVTPMLDDLIVANLAGGWNPTERLRLNVSLPFYLSSSGTVDVTTGGNGNGASLGDTRVIADYTLLDGGFNLGIAPLVDLPSGDPDIFLGQGGVACGGLLTARVETGRLALGGQVGPYFRPAIDLQNIQGTDRVLAGAHLGYKATEKLGLNAETRLEIPLEGNRVSGTDTPAELLLFAHRRADSGAHLMFGGSTAISSGASAALYRLFVGGGFGKYGEAPPEEPPPPPPPAVEAGVAISVYLDDKLVVDVPTKVKGPQPLEVMSALNPIEHGGLTPGDTYTAVAKHGPCMKGKGEATVPESGFAPLRVDLVPHLGAQVRLEIYDAQDKPLNGGVVTWEREVSNCVPGEPLVLTETHTGRQSIGVGTHTVFATVEGYNTYVETVTLEEGADELIQIKLAPTKIVLKQDEIVILDKVYFAFDGDEIDPKSGALLDEVAAVLRAHPEVLQVEVGGHTDDRGKDDYNLDLSQRRVDSVRKYLMDKGVSGDRLVAKGYGEARPIASNKTADGRANNRRVEFAILQRSEAKGAIIKTVDEATDAEKKKAGAGKDNRPSQDKVESGEGK